MDQIVAEFRRRQKRVGVIAVDLSSPFSGGAVLGDRIRMQRHATDEGVFIRSMATRGQLGGLSRSTYDASVVLDAMGYDVVLVETVGVGQDDLDHRSHLARSGKLAPTLEKRDFHFFLELLRTGASEKILDAAEASPGCRAVLEGLKARSIDPYSAAEALIERLQCEI